MHLPLGSTILVVIAAAAASGLPQVTQLSSSRDFATELLSKFNLIDSNRRHGFTCGPALTPFACAMEQVHEAYDNMVEKKDAVIQVSATKNCGILEAAQAQVVQSLATQRFAVQTLRKTQSAAVTAFVNASEVARTTQRDLLRALEDAFNLTNGARISAFAKATATFNEAQTSSTTTITSLNAAFENLTSQTQNANCPSAFDVAWADYLKQTYADADALGGLQSGCVPRRFKPNGVYRGLVVLFHGFGACPQMYDELGPLLAAEGMDVIVPLTPGHGINNPNGPHPTLPTFQGDFSVECPTSTCRGPKDVVTNIPTNSTGYYAYVELINTIAALAPPPRAAAGHSLGATMAALAGQAYFNGKPLYDRQLLMNPFVEKSQLLDPLFTWWFDNVATADQWVGYDFPEKANLTKKVCQEEKQGGRAGLCSLQVKHVKAISILAEEVLKAHAPTDTSVAVIYIQDDPTVSTNATRKLATSYETQVTGGLVQRCLLNFTEHSMLSKWSTPGLNRWWSNELACDITNYLSRDIRFKLSSAINPKEGNETYCHLDCTAESCPYDFTAPLTCPSPTKAPTEDPNGTEAPTKSPTEAPSEASNLG